MVTWLLAPFHGRPRGAWLLCGALLAGAVAWWGWATLAALPVALLALWRPRSVAPREPARPDPARDAQDAHRAALETDRALAGVGRESAQREAQGVERAQTADVDALIREHNAERRGRGQR